MYISVETAVQYAIPQTNIAEKTKSGRTTSSRPNRDSNRGPPRPKSILQTIELLPIPNSTYLTLFMRCAHPVYTNFAHNLLNFPPSFE
jgi:hypothetical protein